MLYRKLHYMTISLLGLTFFIPVFSSVEKSSQILSLLGIKGKAMFTFDVSYYSALFFARFDFLANSAFHPDPAKQGDLGVIIILIQFILNIIELGTVVFILLAIINVFFHLSNYERNSEKMSVLRERIALERLEEVGFFHFIWRWMRHKFLLIINSPIYRAFTFSILALVGLSVYHDRRNLVYWEFRKSVPELGYNAVRYSVGWYMLVLAILIIYWISKADPSLKNQDVTNYVSEKRSSFAKRMRGPITIQYLTMHILSLIFMYVTYAIQFGIEQIWSAPTFYLDLILQYGLNYQVKVPAFFQVFSIIFAPVLVLSVGWVLFFLKTSGFAKNGPDIEVFAPQEPRFLNGTNNFSIWGFFSNEVPMAEHYLGHNPKYNGFYLLVVILPVVGGIIISSIINALVYPDRKLNFFNYIKLMMGISAFSSVMMGILSNDIVILPTMVLRTVFADRVNNTFILYDLYTNGTYHPLTTFWILILHMTAIVTFAVLFDSFIRNLFTGKFWEEKESTELIGRTISTSRERLPFSK